MQCNTIKSKVYRRIEEYGSYPRSVYFDFIRVHRSVCNHDFRILNSAINKGRIQVINEKDDKKEIMVVCAKAENVRQQKEGN